MNFIYKMLLGAVNSSSIIVVKCACLLNQVEIDLNEDDHPSKKAENTSLSKKAENTSSEVSVEGMAAVMVEVYKKGNFDNLFLGNSCFQTTEWCSMVSSASKQRCLKNLSARYCKNIGWPP